FDLLRADILPREQHMLVQCHLRVGLSVSPCFARRGALRALEQARQDFIEGGDTGCRLHRSLARGPKAHAPSVQPPAEQAGSGRYRADAAMATENWRPRADSRAMLLDLRVKPL
ncbi:hypothetical protein, partial [Bosea sp. (in: a-proteobacteria)]|uniref:hypothetical protein n=1 Tax=Bosea sp. (in: a-proteobacteria) TaxID=1871050 RepID=UPI003B3B03A1